MVQSLEKFFYPKSICIVGASSKPKSLGYELTKSVKKYGFKGSVLLVNPKSQEILGYKCYPTVNDIEIEIDLAIVMVPKQFVEQSIIDLINKKVSALILITAGFKETGEIGANAEDKILEIIRNSNSRMVGPNCMGIINTHSEIKMNATFVAEEPKADSIAFCSQSGAIGAAVLNSLRETDIRFGQFISVGNKADINENHLLEYWQNCDDVKVITYYLESFIDGEKFIKYFIEGLISKPVIVLKGGRTLSGIKAASSHTGALGTSDKVVDAVLKQFGIIRADNLSDLFNTAKGFEEFPMPKGNRIAVVTNAGGPAILTVDALEKNNLELAELDQKTKLKLKEIVHPEGSVNNPVDLLPGGTAEQFKIVNEILINDINVDAVISIFVEPIMVKALTVIESINEIQSEKPIYQVVMPLPEFWQEYRMQSKTKKALFRRPEEPSVVIHNMLKFSKNVGIVRKNILDNIRLGSKNTFNNFKLNEYINRYLPSEKVAELCEQYEIPMVQEEIVEFEEIGIKEIFFPIVLKAIGEKIIHKTDLKGVILNIPTQEELKEKAEEMIRNFKNKKIKIDRFLIQPYVTSKFELLIGGFRDNSFGPMIMFGAGGKYVEYIQDTVMYSAYLNDKDIDDLINSTNIGKIIQGVRGEEIVDIGKIKKTIKNLAQMLLNHTEIKEVDLNPVIITSENNTFVVDARIKC